MTTSETAGGTDVLPAPDELMNSVLGKLYDQLTSGDGELLEERRNFFSWCTPGWPVVEDEWDFMSGFTGEGETAEDREADAARRYAYAAAFAYLVDFLPDPTGVFDSEQQETVVNARRGTLSGEYGRVLRFSEVANDALSDEDKAEIQRLTGLLRTEREEKDLVSGETKMVTDDSDIVKAYKAKMAAYEAAALEYRGAKIEAARGDVPGAAATFANNGPILRNRVRSALDEWESVGYRHEVDQIRAKIAQMTQRSMVLLKRELEGRLESAKLMSAEGGNEFLYTALMPPNVLRSKGWTEFRFSQSSAEEYREASSNRWKVDAGGSFGFLKRGKAGAEREKESRVERVDTSDFSLSFELTQCPVRRGWFASEFLESRGWRFPPSQAEQPLCDGEEPPSGTLVAYPESVILARNITLGFADLQREDSEVRKHLEAGGSLSFGVFKLGGEYEKGSEKQEVAWEKTEQGIRVPGAQIIGFRCYLLPAAPNPAEGVENWV